MRLPGKSPTGLGDASRSVIEPAQTALGPPPFPSMVVASRDDPRGSFDPSEQLAKFWGGKFLDANAGFGVWDEGRRHS